MIAVLLCAGIGAVAFRVRGGLITDRRPGFSGQAQRGIYAALMAVATLAAGWPWPGEARGLLMFPALVLAWFTGAVAFGTFGAIDAGRNEGTALRDGLLNAVRGALYALPPALVLLAARAWWGAPWWPALLLPAAGLLQGACYELAHRLRPMKDGHRTTTYAEWATGACLGTGAALAAFV